MVALVLAVAPRLGMSPAAGQGNGAEEKNAGGARAAPAAGAGAGSGAQAASAENPTVIWIPVPLPITGSVDTNVIQTIERAIGRLPDRKQDRPQGQDRPTLVLDFQPAPTDAPSASQFERALALARFLAGDRLRQVRTVAYVAHSVTGHAVLPVLACEQLIVAPDAELGDAGGTEAFIDVTLRRGYSEIAERRRTIPVPVALGMLDPAQAVYKVETPTGTQYVLGDDLARVEKESAPTSIKTVKREGDRLKLSGRDLRLEYGFATHLAADRAELAQALQVSERALEADPSLNEGWRPIRVDVNGPITPELLGWIRRSLESRLRPGDRNLVLLVIESPGGALAPSLDFAAFLASGGDKFRTVAFVPREARADAGLLALACDHLVVGDAAVLGGPGAEVIDEPTIQDAAAPIDGIAAAQGIPASWLRAMIDPRVELTVYSHVTTGAVKCLENDEARQLENADAWRAGESFRVESGLTGRRAFELQMARYTASSFDELQRLYQLDAAVDELRPNWAHSLIESLASPQAAGLLLFIAWFALMVEIMTPNLTGAGFISAICFLLYFWSNFLHGTAGWLEIILFIVGVIGVALEVFVIPGFGLFGIVGGLMIVVSLILASQTFVIPRNAYQLSQVPESLWVVVAGGAGVMAGMLLIRRLVPKTPGLRRLMLEPPADEALVSLERREAIVDWSHLAGREGETTTSLVPSGKARFGDEVVDVLSDGDLIERGVRVRVVEAVGNRVVVQRASS